MTGCHSTATSASGRGAMTHGRPLHQTPAEGAVQGAERADKGAEGVVQGAERADKTSGGQCCLVQRTSNKCLADPAGRGRPVQVPMERQVGSEKEVEDGPSLGLLGLVTGRRAARLFNKVHFRLCSALPGPRISCMQSEIFPSCPLGRRIL
jgi:hypothetical protein